MSSYSILCEINSCRSKLSSLYLDLKYAKEDLENINTKKRKFSKVLESVDESIINQKGKLNNLMNYNSQLIFVQKCVNRNTYILDNEVKSNINYQASEIHSRINSAEISINNKIEELTRQISYYENRLSSLQYEYQRAIEEERRSCQD